MNNQVVHEIPPAYAVCLICNKYLGEIHDDMECYSRAIDIIMGFYSKHGKEGVDKHCLSKSIKYYYKNEEAVKKRRKEKYDREKEERRRAANMVSAMSNLNV